MHKLVVLIEKPKDQNLFDERWSQFLLWAEQMPGLLRETSSPVLHTLFGRCQGTLIHELYFGSLQDLEYAMNSTNGRKAGQMLQLITGGQVNLYVAVHHEDDIENLLAARRSIDPRQESKDENDENSD